MITQAFLHCRGIGPVKLKQLHSLGLHNWLDILQNPSLIPFNDQLKQELIEEVERSYESLRNRDIHYLSRSFVSQDQWRILGHFFDSATFFDIETSGLSYYDSITVIVCYHKGQLHYFVEHENLDDFVGLLEDVTLLVSFNGSSFDVPRVLDAFRIPELPCPHIDMRWLCYHGQYKGGLKAIASAMNIHRPEDLGNIDGADALDLWERWTRFDDADARSLLIRYCCADVILLMLVAIRSLKEKGFNINKVTIEDLWRLIPERV